MFIEYAASTRIGKRPRNEDRFLIPQEGSPRLILVADGMGGHRSGDIASKLAAETMQEVVAHTRGRGRQRLVHAVRESNRKIYDVSLERSDCAGMGTTMTAALAEKQKWVIAQVGDSRVYLLEKDDFRQVTLDHSLVAEMVLKGILTPEEARKHPRR